jgi:DNA-binding MarR family transcriptional regulator
MMAKESTMFGGGAREATVLEVRPIGNAGHLESAVKQLISERRRRSSYFPGGLFADPAWDLLLALALAHSRQHRLTIGQLCGRAGVPSTTALRWIAKLTDEGLFVRRGDRTDRRRQFIELSAEAWGLMAAYCMEGGTAMPLAA